jgi:Ni,Fe-hydrogenase III small subunit
MPEPRVVVAAGTDACSGSIWTGPEVLGGVDRVLRVDVYIPGDPPSPIALLHGLLLAAGREREAATPRRGNEDSGGAARGGGAAA